MWTKNDLVKLIPNHDMIAIPKSCLKSIPNTPSSLHNLQRIQIHPVVTQLVIKIQILIVVV